MLKSAIHCLLFIAGGKSHLTQTTHCCSARGHCTAKPPVTFPATTKLYWLMAVTSRDLLNVIRRGVDVDVSLLCTTSPQCWSVVVPNYTSSSTDHIHSHYTCVMHSRPDLVMFRQFVQTVSPTHTHKFRDLHILKSRTSLNTRNLKERK